MLSRKEKWLSMFLKEKILNLFFPPFCQLCQTPSVQQKYFCHSCQSNLLGAFEKKSESKPASYLFTRGDAVRIFYKKLSLVYNEHLFDLWISFCLLALGKLSFGPTHFYLGHRFWTQSRRFKLASALKNQLGLKPLRTLELSSHHYLGSRIVVLCMNNQQLAKVQKRLQSFPSFEDYQWLYFVFEETGF